MPDGSSDLAALGALLHLLLTGAAPPACSPASASPSCRSSLGQRARRPPFFVRRARQRRVSPGAPAPLAAGGSTAGPPRRPGSPRPYREPRRPPLPILALWETGARFRTASELRAALAAVLGGASALPRRAGPNARRGPCSRPRASPQRTTAAAPRPATPAGAGRATGRRSWPRRIETVAPPAGGRGPAGRGGRPGRRPGQDERRMAGRARPRPAAGAYGKPAGCAAGDAGGAPSGPCRGAGAGAHRPGSRTPSPGWPHPAGGLPPAGCPRGAGRGLAAGGPGAGDAARGGAGREPDGAPVPGSLPPSGRLPPRPRCPSPPPPRCRRPAGVCTHTRRCPCAPGDRRRLSPRRGL